MSEALAGTRVATALHLGAGVLDEDRGFLRVPLEHLLAAQHPGYGDPWGVGVIRLDDLDLVLCGEHAPESHSQSCRDQEAWDGTCRTCEIIRVQHLAVHGWPPIDQDPQPVTFDAGLGSYVPPWCIVDGNHRVLAAWLRGDETIDIAICGGLGPSDPPAAARRRQRLVRVTGCRGRTPPWRIDVFVTTPDLSDHILPDSAAVADFMRAFGQTVRTSPTVDISDEERLLRARLVFEEALEFVEAMGCVVSTPGHDLVEKDTVTVDLDPHGAIDLVETTDAIADLIVVTKGSAHTLGVPCDAAFDIVHETNMAKLDPHTGEPIRRADGKVIKPEGWVGPTEKLRALLGITEASAA